MVPYLKGFHLTIKMCRGRQDTEGWKLSEGDEDLMTSNQSLGSLNATWGGRHGLDLSLAASYSVEQAEDEDVAQIMHQVNLKGGGDGVYAPVNGFTTPVPRFSNGIAALMHLANFKLPPLRVWCKFSTGLVMHPESSSGPHIWQTITVVAVFLKQAEAAIVYVSELGYGC